MKMKILLAILLAVLLLTACGSEEKKNTGEAESGAEEIVNTEEETPEEDAEDTAVTDEETIEEE